MSHPGEASLLDGPNCRKNLPSLVGLQLGLGRLKVLEAHDLHELAVAAMGCGERLHHEREHLSAASQGRLDILIWLRAQGCPWGSRTCKLCGSQGSPGRSKMGKRERLPVGHKYLQLCGFQRPVRGATMGAGQRLSHEWDHHRGSGGVWQLRLAEMGLRAGRSLALEHHQHCGSPGSSRRAQVASRAGIGRARRAARPPRTGMWTVYDMPWSRALKVVHELGCPWTEHTSAAAAFGGHLHIVQYLHENGCPWDVMTCTVAAGRSHFDVLRWASSEGCPWDSKTCSLAAMKGQLRMLQWARENGCPWGESTCDLAALNGHLEVVEWAFTNGCPISTWLGCIALEALRLRAAGVNQP